MVLILMLFLLTSLNMTRSTVTIPYIDKFPSLDKKIDIVNVLISEFALPTFCPIAKLIRKTINQINIHQYSSDSNKIDRLFKKVRIDHTNGCLFKPINNEIDNRLTKYIVNKNKYPHVCSSDVATMNEITIAWNYLNESTQQVITKLFDTFESNAEDEKISSLQFHHLVMFIHNVLICDWPFIIDNVLNMLMEEVSTFNVWSTCVSTETLEKYSKLLYWWN